MAYRSHRAVKPVAENQAGALFEDLTVSGRHDYVWVPRDVLETVEREDGVSATSGTHDGVTAFLRAAKESDTEGVTEFRTMRPRGPSTEDQGRMWALLCDRLEDPPAHLEELCEYACLREEERGDMIPTIPVAIAGKSNAVIVGYLYAHGWNAGEIARELEVKESTITQYISDLRSGRR